MTYLWLKINWGCWSFYLRLFVLSEIELLADIFKRDQCAIAPRHYQTCIWVAERIVIYSDVEHDGFKVYHFLECVPADIYQLDIELTL